MRNRDSGGQPDRVRSTRATERVDGSGDYGVCRRFQKRTKTPFRPALRMSRPAAHPPASRPSAPKRSSRAKFATMFSTPDDPIPPAPYHWDIRYMWWSLFSLSVRGYEGGPSPMKYVSFLYYIMTCGHHTRWFVYRWTVIDEFICFLKTVLLLLLLCIFRIRYRYKTYIITQYIIIFIKNKVLLFYKWHFQENNLYRKIKLKIYVRNLKKLKLKSDINLIFFVKQL